MPEPSRVGLRPILSALGAALLVGTSAAIAQPESTENGRRAPSSQAAPAAPAKMPATVTRSGHQVFVTCNQTDHYNCDVVAATVDSVKRALAGPSGAVDTMVLEDTGGDIEPILELGRLIHEHKLTIQIQNACVGPCATFLAPAAERLVVPKGSFVVFFPIYSMEQQFVSGGGAQALRLQKDIELQNSYFRELNVEPEKAYGIGDAALVVKSALAAAGEAKAPLVVPDATCLHNCLRIPSVEMENYTIVDTKDHAGNGNKAALAFLIAGKIYFDGKPLANYHPPCGR